MKARLILVLLVVSLGVLVPVLTANAEDFCGDDPILLIGGVRTNVFIQIPVSAVPSVPANSDATITVEVPRGVEVSVIKEDKGLKYPHGGYTGIRVTTTIVTSNAVNGSPNLIPIKVTVYVPTTSQQFPVLLTVSTETSEEVKTGAGGTPFTLQVNLPK
ncbi:MAG: hypothetical protein HYY02_01110 [Chloroflexi bacterium]|nr:hypothetical protein [Chloroflexota bacterium]